MNEQEVKQFVEGTVEYIYGPCQLNDLEVWEAWVHDGDEYQVRYVTSKNDETPDYFSKFEQLAPFADKRYQKLKSDIRELEEKLNSKKVKDISSLILIYVAASVFVLCVSTLIYLVYKGIEPNITSFTVLAGIIASGGAMFFGAWKQANLPGKP